MRMQFLRAASHVVVKEEIKVLLSCLRCDYVTLLTEIKIYFAVQISLLL